MNRDEILARSRRENAAQDERELQIHQRAGMISKAVGAVLCALINLGVTIVADDLGIVSAVCNIIYSGMFATECWICAVKLKNKKMYWFTAIIFTVFFVFFSIFFVQDLIAWTTN